MNLPNFSIFHFFSDDIKNIFVVKIFSKKKNQLINNRFFFDILKLVQPTVSITLLTCIFMELETLLNKLIMFFQMFAFQFLVLKHFSLNSSNAIFPCYIRNCFRNHIRNCFIQCRRNDIFCTKLCIRNQ